MGKRSVTLFVVSLVTVVLQTCGQSLGRFRRLEQPGQGAADDQQETERGFQVTRFRLVPRYVNFCVNKNVTNVPNVSVPLVIEHHVHVDEWENEIFFQEEVPEDLQEEEYYDEYEYNNETESYGPEALPLEEEEEDDAYEESESEEDILKRKKLAHAKSVVKTVGFFCAKEIRQDCHIGSDHESCSEMFLTSCGTCFETPQDDLMECLCTCQQSKPALSACFLQRNPTRRVLQEIAIGTKTAGMAYSEADTNYIRLQLAKRLLEVKECFKHKWDQLSGQCVNALDSLRLNPYDDMFNALDVAASNLEAAGSSNTGVETPQESSNAVGIALGVTFAILVIIVIVYFGKKYYKTKNAKVIEHNAKHRDHIQHISSPRLNSSSSRRLPPGAECA